MRILFITVRTPLTPRRQIVRVVAPIFWVALSACSLTLREPPGPPAHPPGGLWLHREGERIEALRIVCGPARCWFRDSVIFFRTLTFSGRVVNLTERSGFLETSAGELLQVQTEYRSEQLRLPDGNLRAADPVQVRSTVDRIVRGESRLRILRWDGADRLTDGRIVFERHCPGEKDCSSPMLHVLEAENAEQPALIVSPDLSWLNEVDAGLPPDLHPVLKLGPVYYAKTRRPAGTTITFAQKKDLPIVYESRISLSPGADALDLSRKSGEAADAAKRNRVNEIRRRLKNGEPVTRDEMIEALDGR